MTKIAQALESLKKNQSYQILVEELQRIKSNCETLIFDENIDLERKEALIIKRNTILKFIELPDDIILDENLKEASNTDPSES